MHTQGRPSLAYKRHKLISTMCTMRTYHRNPQPTHAHTESAKPRIQTTQTNQHEEALGTMCTMRTYHRNRDTCPCTDSMSLLHPPTTLLLKAASHVEAYSTNQQDHQALSFCAAAEKITMIQFRASQDLYAFEQLFLVFLFSQHVLALADQCNICS